MGNPIEKSSLIKGVKLVPTVLRNLPQIAEGWFNKLLRPGYESETVIERAKICQDCEFRINESCGVCGCVIEAKIRANLQAKKGEGGCPVKKW